MSQIMGIPSDKLLEDYTNGEKMAYTYNSGYHAAVADVLEIVDDMCCDKTGRNAIVEHDTMFLYCNEFLIRARALLEDKS